MGFNIEVPSGVEQVEVKKTASMNTGEAAALSISLVFIFVGCVAGGACFLKGKWAAEKLKNMATAATASAGVANVQLTEVEKKVMENPMFSKLASGSADNLLAAAVSTIQRAFQEDEKHNFEAALPLYRKANRTVFKSNESRIRPGCLLVLAKRIDSYVKGNNIWPNYLKIRKS